MIVIVKNCKVCDKSKTAQEYHYLKGGKLNLQPVCKKCRSQPYVPHPISQESKTCILCDKTYPKTTDYFSWQNEEKGYLQSKCKKCCVEVWMEKYNNDTLFKLKHLYRDRFRKAVKGKITTKDLSHLGCSIEEWKVHLEGMFQEGMSWDNFGEWEIDHIIPLASATTKKATRQLFHYTNTQPLWASDNRSKGAKYAF